MPIYLPESLASPAPTEPEAPVEPSVDTLTPRQIVAELDKYVISQAQAKRAVAVALRNRMRRQKLSPELAEEVAPKNILMIGPTGVGKTEIARRLARLAQSPFIKVEASKFTEVGYVGRDVESMVRDLVELAVDMVREERVEGVRVKARQNAEARLLDLLLPPLPKQVRENDPGPAREQHERTRARLRAQLAEGRLDEREVEVDVQQKSFPSFEVISGSSIEEIDINIKDMLPTLFQGRGRKRRVKVPEALDHLVVEEEQKLVDTDSVRSAAVNRVEEAGIIFIDEIDKVTGREGGHGPDVSREGVQRDLLPLIEGTTVTTKHGAITTDHILFIASGAFHLAKPADLLPELQGRLPIRVELSSLARDDLKKILTEPENSLIRQYRALMETENVTLDFSDCAIDALSDLAAEVNRAVENIGARRLHTVMEKLLEEISFEAADRSGETITIDAAYVDAHVGDLAKDADLSKFIL
jgi:ATP-dependent HslUV protease ATP-binding subunit HslU